MPSSRFASLAWSLVVALVLATHRPAPAATTTFLVNSTLDAVDAAPGNGACATAASTCTLRAALQEASLIPANDVTVLLPSGLYRLTLATPSGPGCPSGKTGALVINNHQPRTITVVGVGAARTVVDANGIDGAFSISTATGSTTRLMNIAIRGGDRMGPNACNRFGGGVWAYGSTGAGTVLISECVVSDNLAQSGGGIFNEGAIVSVVRSVVRNNRSSYKFSKVSSGGGIENFAGSLTVDASTISGNVAQVVASGLAEDAAGGGIGIFDGPVTITNSTISGNTADGSGGGIDVFGVVASTVQLRNVTVVGNKTDANSDGKGDGGGIANSTASLALENSIVATNIDPGGEGADCMAGAFGSFGIRYAIVPSLQTCASKLMPAAVGLLGVSPLPISPLQANGGLTQTHDLLAGSAARDAGDPGGCGLATDQRGITRPQGSRCDLGAVESGVPDGDGDHVPDAIDDCPAVVNLDQRDIDGDKLGDVCDNCPAVANPTQSTTACLTASSGSGTIDSTGGSLTAGNVKVTVPPGALGGQPWCVSSTCPTSFSITGLANSEYKLGSASSGNGLYLATTLSPEGLTFNAPVIVTFSWPDADANPGIIDGTTIVEAFLRIFQNGTAITNTCGLSPCGSPPCCNATANTFSVPVTSFSEFAAVEDAACVPQAIGDAVLTATHLKPPASDDQLRLTGMLTLEPGKSVADVAKVTGIGVGYGDASHGLIAGARLAPGAWDAAQKRGWRTKAGGTVWRYVDQTATPPGGIRRVVLTAKGTDSKGLPLASLVVRGRGVPYAADTSAEATVTLAPHVGPCFAARFPGAPGPACTLNASGSRLRCQ